MRYLISLALAALFPLSCLAEATVPVAHRGAATSQFAFAGSKRAAKTKKQKPAKKSKRSHRPSKRHKGRQRR